MSSDLPAVSVILPTYNVGSHLRTCLDSILNQTFEDFEVVVVDDGSTDETIDILEGYDDARIRVIQRTENGITSALNRGITEARGEFIARHDGDDYSEPERFEKQVEYLRDNPGVAVVGTGAWLVNSRRGRLGQRQVLERPDLEDLQEHNHYIHGSVMMRASALQTVNGYDEFFETTEDYDLWLRLADEFPVRNINEPLYNFRIHDESIYGSELRNVKLYHALAVLRSKHGLSEAIIDVVQSEGIEAVYDVMPPTLQQTFHAEIGQELIRYGHLSEGRDHCMSALQLAGYTDLMPWLLILLSFLGSDASKRVSALYRKFIVNPRIESANETTSV